MPTYLIRPANDTSLQREFSAFDARPVLDIASQMDCGEADIYQDGRYTFSLRINGRARFWTIFQRDPLSQIAASATPNLPPSESAR